VKRKKRCFAPRVSAPWVLVLTILVFVNAGFCQQTVRTADAGCAPCHAEIYRKYLATPMANASGPAVDRVFAQEFSHAPSGVHYKVWGEQDQVWLGFNDLKDPRIAGKRRFDYFLGSGHLGVTYLYMQQGYLLESPVAWYAATAGYDMKPGFGRLTEMPPALPTEPGCLRCHMSGVAHAEPGTINRYIGAPFRQTGITCESCHGDTSAHVRSRGKAGVVNPARLNAERRDSVCLSCHLEGDVSVERAGRSALDYSPGERISDYLSFFVFTSENSLSRGVSEVEQFGASHCKRASGDRMSCTSCHNPHESVEPAERVAYYRARCLACHSSPDFGSTHHPEQPDCASCHMPRSTAQNIPHVAWTDHRILRWPELASQDSTKNSALIAVFSPQAEQRDVAVAAYQAVVRGKSRDSEGTIARLRQAYAAGARDPQVLEGLGVLAGLSGDAAESEKRLRELLAVEPLNLTALSDLGVLLARQGNLQAAVATWRPAFARNEDVIGLAQNLAAAQCRVGDETGARETIADALKFSPGVRQAWSFMCGR
jgi:predicted CXXCH cytochrome family protein